MSLTASEVKQISLTAGTGTASGTNTYATTITEVKSYIGYPQITVKFTNANTGASTLNVNGLGVINIYKNVTTPLAAGDFPAGSIQYLTFDGTNFQVSLGAALPNGASMAVTTTAAGILQTIYSIVDILGSTTEATLLAQDWTSGSVTANGSQGQKVWGTTYTFECTGTNTWKRMPNNVTVVDWQLANVSDSGGVFTSTQMASLYPNAVVGNEARGNAGFYKYYGNTGWWYFAKTS